jgi:tripartite-type tricarboxylate transporter receptor subunit TctC
MNAEMQAATKTPDVQDKLAASGIETASGSVAGFVAFIATERQRLGALATKAKMRADP